METCLGLTLSFITGAAILIGLAWLGWRLLS